MEVVDFDGIDGQGGEGIGGLLELFGGLTGQAEDDVDGDLDSQFVQLEDSAFARGPVVASVDALEGAVVHGLHAEFDPGFDGLVEPSQKVAGPFVQAVGAGADAHGGKVEGIEQIEILGLLFRGEGGGEGLDVGHVFFCAVAVAGKADGFGHLLFDRLFFQGLDGTGTAFVAEGAAAGAVGRAVGAAEAEVDRHAEERLSIALAHVVLVLEIGGSHVYCLVRGACRVKPMTDSFR